MKRLSVVLTLAAITAVGIAALQAPPARAADVYQATLASSDGGPTQTVTLQGQATYSMQCQIPACVRLWSINDGGPGDCTKDPVFPGIATDQTRSQVATPEAPRVFDTGGYTKLTARALDAGNPSCNLFVRVVNKPRTGP